MYCTRGSEIIRPGFGIIDLDHDPKGRGYLCGVFLRPQIGGFARQHLGEDIKKGDMGKMGTEKWKWKIERKFRFKSV